MAARASPDQADAQALRIFISYRREDAAGEAGRIYDTLRKSFGARNVFMDVDTMRPGDDFVASLEGAVAQCHVLLAIIGRSWATVTDEEGSPRLDNELDFVRIEVVAALESGKVVIPVLVDEAQMPRFSELPDPLKPLARRQAVVIRHARFSTDVGDLRRHLRRHEQDQQAAARPHADDRHRAVAAEGQRQSMEGAAAPTEGHERTDERAAEHEPAAPDARTHPRASASRRTVGFPRVPVRGPARRHIATLAIATVAVLAVAIVLRSSPVTVQTTPEPGASRADVIAALPPAGFALPPAGVVWFGTGFQPGTTSSVGQTAIIRQGAPIIALAHLRAMKPPEDLSVRIMTGGTTTVRLRLAAGTPSASFGIDITDQELSAGQYLVDFVDKNHRTLASGTLRIRP